MFPIETISAKMLDYYADRSDALIIDVRDAALYQKSHIRGALNYPYSQIEQCRELPREKLLIFYCQQGRLKYGRRQAFCKKGYKTRSVIGGFEAYRGRNLVISG